MSTHVDDDRTPEIHKRGRALEMHRPASQTYMIENTLGTELTQADRSTQPTSNEVLPTKHQVEGIPAANTGAPDIAGRFNKVEVDALKEQCPLPVLLKLLGLGNHTKRSCRSPLRDDRNASWGIFSRDGHWYWKDHGTGDWGDEIDFIRQLNGWIEPGGFSKAVQLYRNIAAGLPVQVSSSVVGQTPEPRQKPSSTGFGTGTAQQLENLSKLRNIDLAALQFAQDRGFLIFGRFAGHEVFGITDTSAHVVEVRRLDGELFPAHGELGERKSHALKGSRKDWPVGITGAEGRSMILLVEGLPDFLAAFEVAMTEKAQDRVAPVAMLSASSRIGEDALPLFTGRHVRIVPHNDEPGRAAAMKWAAQVHAAGASKVDYVDISPRGRSEGTAVKDLNDHLPVYRNEVGNGLAEGGLLV